MCYESVRRQHFSLQLADLRAGLQCDCVSPGCLKSHGSWYLLVYTGREMLNSPVLRYDTILADYIKDTDEIKLRMSSFKAIYFILDD